MTHYYILLNYLVFRDILDGLKKVGFKLGTGIQGTGFGRLAWSKAGGYYLGSSTSSL